MTNQENKYQDLTNSVIIVTGASSGIGRATAIELAKHDCRLALLGRNHQELTKTHQEISESLSTSPLIIQCDVRKPQDVQKAIQQIHNQWGQIDILLNIAGLALKGPVDGYSKADWDTVIDTDLTGVFLLTREVLPFMKKHKYGQIINVSSGAGRTGIPELASYCAAKFGVIGFSETVALEVRNENIRVSTICPGSTMTNFHQGSNRTSKQSKHGSYALFPGEVAKVIESMLIQPQQAWMSLVILRPLNTKISR